jgi:hypothetical protein
MLAFYADHFVLPLPLGRHFPEDTIGIHAQSVRLAAQYHVRHAQLALAS